MDPIEFKNSPSGHLVPTIDGAMAFVPAPLPPSNIDLAQLAGPLASATQALGELSGIGRTLPNPFLIIRPFMRVEAVASSKIEGTVTTLPELLMLEVDADDSKARHDTIEVRNYQRALQHGLSQLGKLPTSIRLICEMHTKLLEGVAPGRGARIRPGEIRNEQNWIGARLIQNARFVPPPPKEAIEALAALEKYVHENDRLPLLIKLALIHYQFEAIHPFPDGNGRIGRILVPLILCEQKAMSHPLLYLSAFFERNYTAYIDLLYDVSRLGAWDKWILFFLRGVEESSKNAITKSTALQELRKQYMEKVQSARSSALLAKIVDELFNIPAVTIPHTSQILGISFNSAKNNLRRLVELGILVPEFSQRRPQWFFGREIMRIVSTSSDIAQITNEPSGPEDPAPTLF